MSLPRLADLGPRLCVMGPSNSGKSTLAAAIGRADGRAVVHLDQLRHWPRTAWQPRPDADFAALHAAAIAEPRWVLEGNYSDLFPDRLARATGLILLDLSTGAALWRYVRRTLFERRRHGTLDGAPERIRWDMLRHIAGPTRANRRRYRAMLPALPVPHLYLPDAAALTRFYAAEGLVR